MKKILRVAPFLIILTACSWFGNQNNDNKNLNGAPEMITATGIIRSKSITLDTPGTHMLEQDDGKVLFIQSKTYALSDYLDQKVTIEGLRISQQNTEVVDITSVALALDNENENSAPLSLLQYSGPLNVRFQYSSLFELSFPTPSEIDFSLADPTIQVEKKDTPVIILKVSDERPGDLKSWVKRTTGKDPITIVAGNMNAERVSDTTNNTTDIYVLADKLYLVHYLSPGGKDEITVKNRFYEMLATLLFASYELSSNTNTSPFLNTNINGIPFNKNVNTSRPYTGEVLSTNSSSNVFQKVISYIGSHINTIKPEDAAVQNAVVSKYEFANPNYVYVEYGEGTAKRKLLLRYFEDSAGIRVTQIAYFIPGTTKDWDIKSGSNEAATAPREVYDVGGNKTASVAEGMRLYENTTLGYGIQYPSNWYYGGVPPTNGAIHQINFSDKPLDNGAVKISVRVFKGTLSALGIPSTTITANGNYTTYREMDGRVYAVTGSEEQKELITKMLQSITSK